MKNLKLTIFLFIFAALPGIVSAQVMQQWMARYDSPSHSFDFGEYIDLDPAGNIFIGGTANNPSTGFDLLVCKYTSAGTFLWSKTVTGPGNRNDHTYDMKADAYGNVYLLGVTYKGNLESDINLVKYNSGGDVVWHKIYNVNGGGRHTPGDMDMDDMGNIYITGSSDGPHGYSDAVVIKYDTAGTQIFAKYIESVGQLSAGSSITVDGSGSNLYIAGSYYYDLTYNREFFTAKFNAVGDTVWTRHVRGEIEGDHYAVEIISDNNGNLIVLGNTENVANRDDITVIKYNQSGVEQWKKVINLSGQNDNMYNIACDAAGNIYGGCKKGHSVENDFAIMKFSPAGVIEWTKVFDGGGNDAVSDLTVDDNGFLYVSGMTVVPGQDANSIVLKYNSSGDILWQQQYNNSTTNLGDQGRGIILDNSGNVIITGLTNNTGTAVDALIIKYTQSGVTGVQNVNAIPEKFELKQNYPNPFNPQTNISFALPKTGNVKLTVFDITGKVVAELVNGIRSEGSHTVNFNADGLSSGTYFYKLETQGFSDVKKMILIK